MTIQALPPFVLISVGVAAIGYCQMGVNYMFRPSKPTDGPIQFKKYVGMDTWDYDMSNRDGRLFKYGIKDQSDAKAAWWDWTNPKKVNA
mmetsp:Transcript_6736/g.17242  ORF Transcript_6736/g.17242 Transcript_6736/m.17242 type:complete len:89 (+) Transcript_6736:129-395(+)|eukprot:CAMPEP_0174929914 /NCGR_PEP_ID=MMETSP1355-20121228/29402_1 /TAXON_ID=464990 /ORGANISM="Hemiselmis tepida, Strain CCMP443" /LENGTH=88 /DNA_ID=CAMNT_0016176167 /DNA_START=110 /DNA_END=376 /DNA_ORIENTATION=+